MKPHVGAMFETARDRLLAGPRRCAAPALWVAYELELTPVWARRSYRPTFRLSSMIFPHPARFRALQIHVSRSLDPA